MKKLKLSLQNIEGAEALTRENMKNILGGNEGSDIGGGLACRTTTCSGYAPVVKKHYSGTCGYASGPGPTERCMCKTASDGNYVHSGCSY